MRSGNSVVCEELNQELTRRERIRRRPEFLQVQQRGVRTRGRYLTLLARPNGLGVNRLGIVATRRLGGATIRNRAKRVVREIFRQHKPGLREGVDFVVMPKPGFASIAFSLLVADYLATFKRYERAR